jgi:FKBP-type peptidyl-prolyl cis-trans isomerase SlyD
MWAMLRYRLFDAEGEPVLSDAAEIGFVFGYGTLLPSVEQALFGKNPGESLSVVLSPQEAYGKRDPKAVLEVDRSDFPEDVAPGDRFEAENDEGSLVVLRVLDVNDEVVTLDGNHPLAGQKIRFELELLEVRPASAEELSLAEALLEDEESLEVPLIAPESLLRGGGRRYEKGPEAEGITPSASEDPEPKSRPGSDSDGE